MKKLLLILTLIFSFNLTFSQTTYTASGGNWESGSSWIGGIAPGFTINTNNHVIIPDGTSVYISTGSNHLIINGTLTIGGDLSISDNNNVLTNNNLVTIWETAHLYLSGNHIGPIIINNHGEFINWGLISFNSIYSNKTITNHTNGTFNNHGIFKSRLSPEGTTTIFTNNGTFLNSAEVRLFDSIINNNSFTNTGAINQNVNIQNNGLFTNSGIVNEEHSSIDNSFDFFTNSSSGTFQNSGTVNIAPFGFGNIDSNSSTFNNQGIFNNLPNAVVRISSRGSNTYNNSGTTNNNGIFRVNNIHGGNNVFTNSSGTVNNYSIIDIGTSPHNESDSGSYGTSVLTNNAVINNSGLIKTFTIISTDDLFPTTKEINNHNTINNTGTIENNATFTNSDTINNINIGFITNNNTFNNTGGTLNNSATFSNNATLNATNISYINNNNDGVLINNNAFTIEFNSRLTVTGTNSIFNNYGTATFNGQVTSNTNGLIANMQNAIINNSGIVSIYSLLTNNGQFTNPGSVSIAPNGELKNENTGTFTNNNNFSLIGGTLTNSANFINTDNFNFSPDGTLPTLTNSGNGVITNQGIINFASGSFINDAELINTNRLIVYDNTLNNNTNGVIRNNNSGAIEIVNNSSILTNTGLFENNNSATVNIDATSILENNFGTIQNNAIINNLGRLASFQGPIINSSTGVINNNNELINVSSTITNQGTLSGSNTSHSGSFSNGGTISPGNSPGTYTFNDGLVLESTSNLEIEIESTSSYDVITSLGSANLNGQLTVNLLNGFNPVLGDSFTIATAGFISGTFSTLNLPALTGNLGWDVVYNSNSVVLKIVEPASITSVTTPTISNPYTNGDVLTFSVTFSQNVNVNTTNGTPTVDILIGPNPRVANYDASGSGTNTLVFNYVIHNNDDDGLFSFITNNGLGSIDLNLAEISTTLGDNLPENILLFPYTDLSNVNIDTAAIVNTQDITVSLDASGQAIITPEDINNNSTDIGAAAFALSLDTTTFDCNNIGTNQVTLTITDSGNNVSSNTAEVTVVNDFINVITQDITVNIDPNTYTAVITTNHIDNGSTTSCGVQSMTISQDTFTCNDVGNTIAVDLTITNTSGISSIGSANVTITDTNSTCALFTYVPDDNFENYLETHNANGDVVTFGDTTSLGNGIANDDYVVKTKINAVTNLDISNLNILDITGIENFTSLLVLNCESNPLTNTNLDISALVNLTELKARLNQLTTITFPATNNLSIVELEGNSFTNIDLSSQTSLTELDISNNLLNAIDVSFNLLLEEIDVSDNSISSINLSNNTNLKNFSADDNSISNISFANNPNLESVFIENNGLTAIDLTQNPNLQLLVLIDNLLNAIDLSNNTNLFGIEFGNNNLTNLDLSLNTNLQFLYAYGNSTLTQLNLNSNLSLVEVKLDGNNLNELSIQNGFNSNITTFNILNNPNLTCVEVDSASYSTANWTNIDPHASFNTDCSNILSTNSFNLNSISVFPNPANNQISINGLNTTQSVDIYNIAGQKILETKVDINNTTINISQFSNGMYFLKIKDTTIKFIKN